MVGLSGILGTGQAEDQKMIKNKLIDGKKTVRRFRDKLVKMITGVGSKFERYKNLSQEEKDKIKEFQRKKYQELIHYKKEALKNK